MTEIFRQEYHYLKHIFQSSRIQKFKGNNWEKAFLVLGLYLLIDVFLGFTSWYGLICIFPIIEEADQLEIDSFKEAIILAVILAPLFEETMFRLFLKFSRARFNISLLLISLSFFAFSGVAGSVMLILWLVQGIMMLDRRYYIIVQYFWLRNRKVIFWLVVLFFGLIHLDNYDLDMIPWYLYFPTVLPQLIGGVFLGIVRIRFGFLWAILLHASFNFVASLEMLYL
ncbi:type II CAAX prenyl endopeptidase Rce1 family protein [Aquiflexum sp.]|uniref:CPBP family glutamic-type intramembrane protease n=1 Tax=Aquiflexum sp. TaxID=1872584 RepID=UPI0035931B41